MKKTIVALLLLFLMLHTAYCAQKCVIRIEKPDQQTVKELNSSKYDVAAYYPGKYLDLVVTDREKIALAKKYSFKTTQTESQLISNLNSAKTIDGYRDYDQMLTELQLLISQNPGILKIYNFGPSTGKNYAQNGYSAYNNFQHDIWAVKLSDNVAVQEDEPEFYFMGEHHAREPIGLEVCLNILHELVDNYGTNQLMTDRVNNSQIWFVPLVNPNGHKIVMDQTDVWQRKNIRDNDSNHQINLYNDGVDLNRNYSFEWSLVGSSDDITEETYHGPNPFSEAELQGIKSMMENHKFVAGISYHTYSELVLYPFGYASDLDAPDHLALEALATDMALTIPSATGSGTYTPQSSWELYPCSGTTDDYSYGNFGTFSYTIEMATEFIPPASDIPEIVQNNLQASMILLDRVKKSTLTGLVKDSQTGLPLVAEIRIEEIDSYPVYRAPYTSDSLFGRYYRLLQPGTYTAKISAYGYQPQTINNLQVTNNGVTQLNAQLVPLQSYPVSGIVTKSVTGNPIYNAKIQILDSPVEAVYTNNNGEYQFSGIYSGTYRFRVSADNCANLIQEKTVSTGDNIFNFSLMDPEPAWETIYTQDFESGSFPPTGWTNSSPGWSAGTESHTGAKCAKALYQPSGIRILTMQPISDLGTYDSLRISFWWKDDDIEKVSGYDSTWCEYSTNGTSWTTLAILSKSAHESSYNQCVKFLPAGITQPLKFRWRDKTDGTSSAWGTGLDDILIQKKTLTAEINPSININRTFSLAQNYPNPFNNTTVINFDLKSTNNIKLAIYNAKGQLVKNLVNGLIEAGKHSIAFDAADLNSGVYFYKLETDKKYMINKMLLIK